VSAMPVTRDDIRSHQWVVLAPGQGSVPDDVIHSYTVDGHY